jgi:hypothetical protein
VRITDNAYNASPIQKVHQKRSCVRLAKTATH